MLTLINLQNDLLSHKKDKAGRGYDQRGQPNHMNGASFEDDVDVGNEVGWQGP